MVLFLGEGMRFLGNGHSLGSSENQRAIARLRAGGTPALLCRFQAIFQGFDFGVQSFGEMSAEFGEMLLDQRHFR